MIKAAIFDMDGTLADTIPLTLMAIRKSVYDIKGIEYSDEFIISKFGPIDTVIVRDLVDKEDIEKAIELYIEYFDKYFEEYVKPFDGVGEVLAGIKDRGIKVGLFTGRSQVVTELILKRLGIGKYFDRILAGDFTKNPKPDPEGINIVLDGFDASPKDSFYIGDTDVDVLASRAAGVKSLLALWSSTANEDNIELKPDAYFRSIGEFSAWVKGNCKG